MRKRLHDATTQSFSGSGSASEALREREADKLLEQLLEQLQENERDTEHRKHEAERLATVLETSDAALFGSYADRIKRFLDLSAAKKCRQVDKLVKSLTLGELGMNIELIHAGDSRKLPTQQPTTVIRDTVPLPGVLLLKNKPYLRRLYIDEELSARSIARWLDVGVTTVTDYLQRHGIARESHRIRGKRRPRQVSYGYDLKDGKLVPNKKEQRVIQQVRKLRAAGLTLRDIAAHLNRKLVPTKRGGVWGPSNVHRLLRQPK